MKKQVLGLSMLASLVMGMAGMAHASQSATITFTGDIAKATCDVSVNGSGNIPLGSFVPTQFTVNQPLKDSEKTTTLAFGNCDGAEIAAGDSIDLKAEPTENAPAFTTAGLFGDGASANTNVGVSLKASVDGKAAVDLKPDEPLAIFTADAATPAASAVIDPVVLTAALQSIATPKPGAVKSTVVFSAVYP